MVAPHLGSYGTRSDVPPWHPWWSPTIISKNVPKKATQWHSSDVFFSICKVWCHTNWLFLMGTPQSIRLFFELGDSHVGLMRKKHINKNEGTSEVLQMECLFVCKAVGCRASCLVRMWSISGLFVERSDWHTTNRAPCTLAIGPLRF